MRKIWKKGLVTALSMALAVSNCIPAMAAGGWREDASGWYYENSDGSLQKGWLQDVDGKWYFLDNATGAMITGWVQDADSVWYYMTGSGAMQTGWVNDNGTWYYTNASGAMQTGWVNDNGTWYYTNASGAMQTGWVNDNGTWYYTNASGAMQTGWVNDNGTYYYMNTSGAMQTGTIVDSGKTYTLNANGTWDGKAGVKVSSSSSRPSSSSSSSSSGSSSSSSSRVEDTEWYGFKSTGNIVVTKGTTLKQADVEAKGIKKVNNVTISDSVGDGNVTLKGLEINGNLNVNGGGAESVTLNGCTIKKNVVANKSASAVHISFGEGTTVGGEIEAKGKEVLISITNPVMVIKAIIANAPVTISGVKGAKVEVLTIVKEEIKVEIGVAVDKVETGTNVDAKEVEIVVDPDVKENVKLDQDIVDSGNVKNEEVTTPDVTDNGTEDPTPEKPTAPTVDSITVSGSAVQLSDDKKTGTVAVTGSAVQLSTITVEGKGSLTNGTFVWENGDVTIESGKAYTLVYKPTDATTADETNSFKVAITITLK